MAEPATRGPVAAGPAELRTGLVRLDGATATELQRRGIEVRDPWWTNAALRTAAGRAVLHTIHAEYRDAGVDVITANTFRCNLRALKGAGLDREAAAGLVRVAVNTATAALDAPGVRPPALVAGSLAPVADCYRPDLVPDQADLRIEHAWLAAQLRDAQVDVVLIETMNTLREARTALDAVLATGGRAWVSFVTTADARLLSGELLAGAARAVEGDGAEAVLVNCASLTHTEASLRVLADVCEGPIGAYPNVEDRRGIAVTTHVNRYLPPLVAPGEFAEAVRRWRAEFGIALAGGCCGTTPEHLAALREAANSEPPTPPRKT